jgi:hypothetical protein
MLALGILGLAVRVHPFMIGTEVAAKSGDLLFVSQELLDRMGAADAIELQKIGASVRVIDVGDWPTGVRYAHSTML